jgi:hypothetical protein
LVFFIIKTVLPKKYRLDDQKIKKNLKNVSVLFDNIARPNDTIPQILSKSKNIFNHFFENSLHKGIPIEDFKDHIELIERGEYEVKSDYQFMENIYPQLDFFAELSEYVTDISDLKQIHRVTFNVLNEEHSLYVVKNVSLRGPGAEEFAPFFAFKKGFDYYKLIHVFFERNGNAIKLSFNNKLQVSPLEFEEKTFFPDEDLISKLERELEKFDEQRSWLFEGPPGTGKTSTALYMARKRNAKIAQLDSSIFTNTQDSISKSIISNLQAEFIIVDDIDHISIRDISSFLFALSAVKKYKGKPTFIASCNNIMKLEKAIIRPGRFDRIFSFNAPNENARKQFFKKMLLNYSVFLDDESINKLARTTSNMTEAYLDEYCKMLKIGENIEDILIEIKNRKKYLGIKSSKDIEELEDDIDTKLRINELVTEKE